MWLTLDEMLQLGLNPSRYAKVSKMLRVVVAECQKYDSGCLCIFADLKTGYPVLYFDTCEAERRALNEVCYNLSEVDHMTVGNIALETLLEILETHAEST